MHHVCDYFSLFIYKLIYKNNNICSGRLCDMEIKVILPSPSPTFLLRKCMLEQLNHVKKKLYPYKAVHLTLILH